MGVYRWQGAVAPLADEDGLDGAVSYINGTAGVHVRRRNFRTSGGTPDCRRKQRLQLSNSGYNTGDCFIAAVLKHTCPLSKPTPLQIADLRAEARLPECGSATEGHMLQLLKHPPVLLLRSSAARASERHSPQCGSRHLTLRHHGDAREQACGASGHTWHCSIALTG